MTARELVRLLLRRWYVMVVGAALTLGAMSQVWSAPGLYWTQFDVVLLVPQSERFPNNIEDPRLSITPMAGLLVTEFNGDERPRQLASSSTTLYGEGVRSGHLVRLPNRGSQWLPIYSSPTIDVQVVDSDPDVVADKAAQISARLAAILKARQDELRVDEATRMSAIVSPSDPVVSSIPTSRSRALLATGLVGATLSIALVYWLERWRLARRAARAPSRGRSEVRRRLRLARQEPSST